MRRLTGKATVAIAANAEPQNILLLIMGFSPRTGHTEKHTVASRIAESLDRECDDKRP